MNAHKVIKLCREKNITLSLEQEQLKIKAPKGAMTKELLALLKDTKEEVIALLKKEAHLSEQTQAHLATYTASDFPLSILSSAEVQDIQASYPQIQNLYVATPMQQGMLFHAVADGNGHSYTNQMCCDLLGELDEQAFLNAWQYVVDRHDIFRTCFVGFDTKSIHQLVNKCVPLSLNALDWRAKKDSELCADLEKFQTEDKDKGFDFAQSPLMRLHLIRIEDSKYRFIWSNHHVLIDGWSFPIVFSEVMQSYMALCQGRQVELPPVIQFEHYIKWLRQQDHDEALKFWKSEVASLEHATPLVIDQRPDRAAEPNSYELEVRLSEQVTEELVALAKACNSTVFVTLQCAWAYLLSCYSGEQDVVFGATVSGRPAELSNVNSMLGMFINTVPFRVNISGEQSLKDMLQKQNIKNLQLEEHAYISLAEIQKQVSLTSGRALFDSIIVFNNFPVEQAVNQKQEAQKLYVKNVEFKDHTNYGIGIEGFIENGLTLKFGFCESQFSVFTIHALSQHLTSILEGMAKASPELMLKELSLIDEREKDNLLTSTSVAMSKPLVPNTLSILFEQQAIDYPSKPALIEAAHEHSFTDLNAYANQLAHYYRELGFQHGDNVGIVLERGVELVASVIALWKLGAVYVPIEPDYPLSKIAYISTDAKLSYVVTDQSTSEKLSSLESQLCILDSPDTASRILAQVNSKITTVYSPDTTAYIIYTSGSTGQSKGVEVSHANVQNFITAFEAQLDLLKLPEESPWLWNASFAFDGSLKGFAALLTGRSVVLASRQQSKDVKALAQLIAQHRVQVFNSMPAMVSLILDEVEQGACSAPHIIVSGDVVSPALWQKLVSYGHIYNRKAINAYGPTELTVNATYGLVEQGTLPNIGSVIPNTFAYVLDQYNNPVPNGIPGELCCGGASVARGYLNKPEQTDKSFIIDPVDTENRRTLYKTGDIVIQQADGRFEFVGRKDQQVKVRGYRIELGEIENALARHEEVQRSLVLVEEDEHNNKKLVCYVEAPQESADSLSTFLSEYLPDYMIPSKYIFVSKWPTTAGGKIDKRNLPKDDIQQPAEIILPRTELEHKLWEIWREVLNVDTLCVSANFFSVGGDSILSIQMISRALKKEIKFTAKDFYSDPCIQSLAAKATSKQPKKVLNTAKKPKLQGKVHLLPIQQRFFAQCGELYNHYNQSLLLEVPKGLSFDCLQQSMAHVLTTHDSFSLLFSRVGNEVWEAHYAQPDLTRVVSEERFSAVAYDEQTKLISAVAQRTQTALDIENGILFRAVHIEVEGQQNDRLLLVCHHLIIDGLSWRILLTELESTFKAFSEKKAVRQNAQSADFKAWSDFVHQYANKGISDKEEAHWENIANTSVGQIGQSLPAHENLNMHSQWLQVALDERTTTSLIQSSNKAYGTRINELLLSGLSLALGDIYEGSAFRVDLEGHGRELLEDAPDVNDTIGWLTSIYPVVLKCHSQDIAQNICTTKENLRAIPNNGIGYGLLKHIRQSSNLPEINPEYLVLFNYLGQLDQALETDSVFKPAKESTGEDRHPSLSRQQALVINAHVFNGELVFIFDFNSQQVDEHKVQAVADTLVAKLKAIVEHCTSQSQVRFTPSDFPLSKATNEALFEWQRSYDLQDVYLATPMQQGLIFHNIASEQSSAYVSQTWLTIKGDLDLSLLEEAWNLTLQRHDVLRTCFTGFTDDIHQIVCGQIKMPWHNISAIEQSRAQYQPQFNDFRAQDKQLGFDLSLAPLMRITTWKFAENEASILWTHHHALVDGWCASIVFSDVMSCYFALNSQQTIPVSARGQFKDYIAWLDKQDIPQALEFWRNTLCDFNSSTKLPKDLADDVAVEETHKKIKAFLSIEVLDALSARAQQLNVTLNTFIQIGWGYVLHRYSGDEKVIFGTVVSGRPAELPNVEDIVGLFIRSIPIVADFSQGTFSEAVQAQQLRHQTADQFSYLPLSEIQKSGQLDSEAFESLVVFSNYPINQGSGAVARSNEFDVVEVGIDEQTNYPLTIAVDPGAELLVTLNYAIANFSAQRANQLLEDFLSVLNCMVHVADNAMIHELEMTVDRSEQRNLLSHSTSPDDLMHSVQQLFEDRVRTAPDRVAIAQKYQDELTYGQLNEKVNRLAHYLREQGVMHETLIGVCCDRSPMTIIAQLAVLKAGGAFVSLDPKHPSERLTVLINESGISVLLASHLHEELLGGLAINAAIVPVDDASFSAKLNLYSPENPPMLSEHSASTLAYVIYTSGSTGKPKGVMIEHKGLINLAHVLTETLQYDEQACLLQYYSLAFDAGVEDWLVALCAGAKLQMVDEATLKDIEGLTDLIQASGATHLHIPPEILTHLEPSQLRSVRFLEIGGEKYSESLARKWAVQATFYNVYGPTETTITSSLGRWTEQSGLVLGEPIANLSYFVLDEIGRPCPAGRPGELYIGGVGVARGYLNNPELTAASFVTLPTMDGARVYKTGDLVEYTSDGSLVFVGRVDNQVKLHGYRIELGEIEYALNSLQQIKTGVVKLIDSAQGEKFIAAYLIADEQRISTEEIRTQLSAVLPHYMLPSAFVFMDEFKLTNNGKIDKGALLQPSVAVTQSDRAACIEPRTELESQLFEIWKSVLNRTAFGVTDNFFTVGGDSILSIQVVARAKRQGISLSVKQLFETPTISELAERVLEAPLDISSQSELSGACVLAPVQRAFFATEHASVSHFNQSAMLHAPIDLSAVQLHKLVGALLRRHDGLRLTFQHSKEKGWRAKYRTMTEVAVAELCDVADVSGLELTAQQAYIEDVANSTHRSLDISKGILFKVIYFEDTVNASARLLIIAHHLVVDGVSWRILIDDLNDAFSQVAAQQITLPPKTDSSHTFASALTDGVIAETLQMQKAYWRDVLEYPVYSLCQERAPRPHADFSSHSMILSQEHTDRLLTLAAKPYKTHVQELLLAGFYLALQEWCGADAFRIMLEGHGRTGFEQGPYVNDTVGWFTSIYPFLLKSDSKSFAEVICELKERLRSVPNQGDGYQALAHMSSDNEALGEGTGRSDILFNYLGQFSKSKQDIAFYAVPEYSGKNVADDNLHNHVLEFNGRVFDGQLYFRADFAQTQYSEASIQDLMACFEKQLIKVIEHCCTAEAHYTPADFPLAQLSVEQLNTLQEQYDIEDIYPTTAVQKGLIFHSMMESEQGSYITQTWYRLRGDFNLDSFKQSWQAVVNNHNVFRTAFIDFTETMQQLVVEQAQIPWDYLEYSSLSQKQQDANFEMLKNNDKTTPFNFAKAPLMRFIVIKLSEDETQILWTHHHALLDGWCLSLVLQEVLENYHRLNMGQSLLKSQAHPYKKYVEWVEQRDELADKSYWQSQLSHIEQPTLFASSNLTDDVTGVPFEQVHWLTEFESSRLQSFAQSSGVTLNTLFQCAWGYLLSRYNAHSDVVFGATVSGRPATLQGVESMIGLFIKTLPVCMQIDEQTLISAWLKEVHKNQVSADEHNTYPLNDIIQTASCEGPLFDSLLVFENYPIDEQLAETSAHLPLQITDAGVDEQTHYGITLKVVPGERLKIKIESSTHIHSAEFVAHLLEYLNHILTALCSTEQSARIADIAMYSDDKKEKLLLADNDTTRHFEADRPLYKLFEQQAEETPDGIAVVDEHGQFSYSDLNKRANRLAHRLIQLGVAGGKPIGVYLPRSLDTVVTMWAIWKAGGAYLPLDLDLPSQRLAYMIENGDLDIVVTQSQLSSQLPEFEGQILLTDEVVPQSLHDEENPEQSNDFATTQLAYVIYTSGSSGNPKGVMVEHRALINRIEWMQNEFAIDKNDVVMHKTPLSFDVSMWELTWPFIVGATMVVAGQEDHKDPQALAALIRKHNVSVLHFVPAMLDAMLVSLQWHTCTSVEKVFSSGEALRKHSVDSFSDHGIGKLFNLYGPTEAAIDVTHWSVDAAYPGQAVPIGKAIQNVRLYILDDALQPVPFGAQGELYIAGECLARGYMNLPELTATHFIEAALSESLTERLYKTGDLVRQLSDGNIEHLGRRDTQVKIRGVRIELAEIEAAILAIPGIKQSAVNVQTSQSGADQLIGYCVVDFELHNSFDTQDCIQALKQRLPEYMVPSAMVLLDTLPITQNGKLDRKALPKQDVLVETAYAHPETEIQSKLCILWQQVLKQQSIGIYDNFFSLGGDSIVSIQLASVGKQHGLFFTVKQLFSNPTIAALAEVVSTVEQVSEPQGMVQGEAALLPIQSAFFEQPRNSVHHYNQSVMLKTPEALEHSHLLNIVEALVHKHDNFRLRFENCSGGWKCRYERAPEQVIDDLLVQRCVTHIAASEQRNWIEAESDKYQRSLDINKGTVAKFVWFTGGSDGDRLLIVIHHLIVDGISWRILLRDLESAYQQLVQNLKIDLGAKTCAFQKWSRLLNDYASSPQLQAERGYWAEQLAKPVSNLPSPMNSENTVQEPVRVRLSEVETNLLLGQCKDAYRTDINELLLSALAVSYQRWGQGETLCLNMEGHGREFAPIDVSLDSTVGWFTVLYPLILDIRSCADNSFEHVIKTVKEQVRAVPAQGMGYGLLLYVQKDPQVSELSQNRTEQAIEFNYLGQTDNTFSDKGEFTIVNDPKGHEYATEDVHKSLVINGFVYDGQLTFSFAADMTLVCSGAIENFASLYQDALSEIVEHCMRKLFHSDLEILKEQVTLSDDFEMEQDDEGIEI